MPPKRIGPLTQREADQRANQARRKDDDLGRKVVDAVRGGAQPGTFNRTQGRFLDIGGRRVRLQLADGTLTDAGRHYHSAVGEDPPLMYSYEQPLHNDRYVWGYNGNRVTVRQWKDGAWRVTKEGENYFKHNKNEYVVHVPVRRAVKREERWAWAQGRNQHNPSAIIHYAS